jgi:hypothetical protein
MGMHRHQRRFATWLATFAILLAALAPTVSHAMAALHGAGKWVEVCTATGPAVIKVASGETPAPVKDGASHFEHCPFCAAHAGAAPLSPATTALSVADGRPVLPELFYRAPRPLFTWAASQPRGPPAA